MGTRPVFLLYFGKNLVDSLNLGKNIFWENWEGSSMQIGNASSTNWEQKKTL